MHAIEVAVPCDFPCNETRLILVVLFIHAFLLNDILPNILFVLSVLRASAREISFPVSLISCFRG
jgi:hypothetical protein